MQAGMSMHKELLCIHVWNYSLGLEYCATLSSSCCYEAVFNID